MRLPGLRPIRGASFLARRRVQGRRLSEGRRGLWSVGQVVGPRLPVPRGVSVVGVRVVARGNYTRARGKLAACGTLSHTRHAWLTAVTPCLAHTARLAHGVTSRCVHHASRTHAGGLTICMTIDHIDSLPMQLNIYLLFVHLLSFFYFINHTLLDCT